MQVQRCLLWHHSNYTLSTWIFFFLSIFSLTLSADSQKPHIIFILADDLGWNDVGFHGMRDIPTPNIDALASDGIILNNYYTQALCTPSRAALMTGYYPIHLGLQHLVIICGEARGLTLSHRIMPQWLNDFGYVSRIVGKWHLGFAEREYLPTNRGFKSFYGFYCGFLDYFHFNTTSIGKETEWAMDHIPDHIKDRPITLSGYNFRDDDKVVTDLGGQYLTDVLTNRATEIIHNHNTSQPLFLYLAYHAVHRGIFSNEISSHPRYKNRFQHIVDSNRQEFAGKLTALDESIGQVFEALQEKGMLGNSIVAFSSDNGGGCASFSTTGGSNWPLRSEKITNWEGGVRNVGFVWSPLLKKSRRISNQLMHITDWLPTLYSAAGGKPSDLGNIDGVDMWRTLSEDGDDSPREEVLINIDSTHNNSAIKRGYYKLVQGFNQYIPNLENSWDDCPDGREPGPTPVNQDSVPVVRSLRIFHRDPNLQLKTPNAEITCGPRPTREIPKCDLCLFDIRKDPCEYDDIAAEHPEIVSTLWKRIQELNATALPPENPPIDYNSNPDFYGGIWTPWIQKTVGSGDSAFGECRNGSQDPHRKSRLSYVKIPETVLISLFVSFSPFH